MPPDADWVREWLRKADLDLQAARRLMSQPPHMPEIVCFHAQQAVEKFLKAFLVYHEVEFEKVHAIRYLLDLCVEIDSEYDCLRDRAEPLSRHAVQGRYPMSGPEINEGQAAETVRVAGEIREFVLARMPFP